MARPSKPAKLIAIEGKAHRTKKELAHRSAKEAETISGFPMKEDPAFKKDTVAHKIFQSTRKMMKAIGKDDLLYSAVVNRYAVISSEVHRLENSRMMSEELLEELRQSRDDYSNFKEYAEAAETIQSTILEIDKQLKAKRQQLFSIEKESCMTIASALRSIPKTPETKTSALREALGG